MEMMASAAITAALMVASMVVVRSSYAAWQAHEGDQALTTAADAVLRHIVRNIRQAESVTAISAASDSTGRLDLTMPSASVVYWEHLGNAAGEVVYNAADSLLADGIDGLWFEGFEADGVTPASDTSKVQLIRCTVQVTLPRGAGETRTVSCYGWIRSW